MVGRSLAVVLVRCLLLYVMTGLGGVFCANHALADDLSIGTTNKVVDFTRSLPRLSQLNFASGEFKVRDAGDAFLIDLLVAGKVVWNGRLVKEGTDEPSNTRFSFYEAQSIAASGRPALFLNAYGLNAAYPFSYLVFPSLADGHFIFLFITESARLRDLDADNRPELVTTEFQGWAFDCFSNADQPNWHTIYRLSPSGDKLIDVSSQFPDFYKRLSEEYDVLYRRVSATYASSTECTSALRQLIRNADQLSRGASDMPPEKDRSHQSGRKEIEK